MRVKEQSSNMISQVKTDKRRGYNVQVWKKCHLCTKKNISLLLRDYCEEENAWNLSPS